MFDVLIRGGTVVDGSGDAPVTADVAVRDGRIVEVGETVVAGGELTDARPGRLIRGG